MEKFKYVLYLFACAAKGEKVELIKNIDIREIYVISRKHGIWTIVFPVIKELYKKDQTVFGLNKELFDEMNFLYVQMVTKNVVKWQKLPALLNQITQSGIEVCMLKGLTLGVLYKEPYTRRTADIDLLVKPTEEELVCKILEDEGFDIKYKWEGSHHTKCTRSDVGLVEIHTQLYDKEVQKVWFGMMEDQDYAYDSFEYDGLVCQQLNATDGLIFTFLHFVKHYISGIITIKQLMDVALFIKKNRERIDFQRFEKMISSLNYDRLAKAFKCLAVNYLGFSYEDLQEDRSLNTYSDDAECILVDMEKYAASENASVYHVYTQSLLFQDKKSTSKSKVQTVKELVWANEKRMKELYGEAYEKKGYRLFFQMHRLIIRLFRVKKYIQKKQVAKATEMSNAGERVALFEKLEVLRKR